MVAQADPLVIHGVQRRDRRVHRVEIASAVRCRHIGERRVPEYATLDQFHDEERRTDDCPVGAGAVDIRDRHGRVGQRRHDPRFPQHVVSAFHQRAGGPATQHVASGRGRQTIGRIRLSPLELLDAQRPGEPIHIGPHPGGKRSFVEPMGLPDGRGAGIGVVIESVRGRHCPAFQSRLIFLAKLHLWTSVGPS